MDCQGAKGETEGMPGGPGKDKRGLIRPIRAFFGPYGPYKALKGLIRPYKAALKGHIRPLWAL